MSETKREPNAAMLTQLRILRSRVTRAESDLDRSLGDLRDAHAAVQNRREALDRARNNLNVALEREAKKENDRREGVA